MILKCTHTYNGLTSCVWLLPGQWVNEKATLTKEVELLKKHKSQVDKEMDKLKGIKNYAYCDVLHVSSGMMFRRGISDMACH